MYADVSNCRHLACSALTSSNHFRTPTAPLARDDGLDLPRASLDESPIENLTGGDDPAREDP